MRLEWLEDILAVIETGSLARAAERRGLSQPAFSRRIRTIEDRLGTELFDRTRKPVEPRAALRDQRPRIAEIAAELRALTDDLRGRGARARIVIAGQHAITTSVVPALVRRLAASRDLDIRLRSANREECYVLLLTRQADIALLHATERHPLRMDAGYVETRIVGADALIPVLAAPRAADLPGLIAGGEVPVVAYPRGVFLGRVLADEVRPRLPRGLALRPMAETALTPAALQLALTGVAVAWVPETLARGHLRSGELVDLRADAGRRAPRSGGGARQGRQAADRAGGLGRDRIPRGRSPA